MHLDNIEKASNPTEIIFINYGWKSKLNFFSIKQSHDYGSLKSSIQFPKLFLIWVFLFIFLHSIYFFIPHPTYSLTIT